MIKKQNREGLNVDKKIKIKKSVLKRLYNEFGSVYKIAERLGKSPSSIYYYIDKYNIDISKKRFPYTKSELIKLHEKHGSITKVAAALSKSYSTVRYWYNAFDIIVNKSGMMC
jgi:transposase